MSSPDHAGSNVRSPRRKYPFPRSVKAPSSVPSRPMWA
ncbi:Uncharacterised protein [Mycobacteroides abscessus]|nr:Uncharacterised protein [Mycobacteroides abscessus]